MSLPVDPSLSTSNGRKTPRKKGGRWVLLEDVVEQQEGMKKGDAQKEMTGERVEEQRKEEVEEEKEEEKEADGRLIGRALIGP